MDRKNNLEQGQIAVLFMLAVVALLGFAALSIDGGRLYFQKRAAQSAADDAAMTGALAIANGYNSGEIQTIIYNRTRANGFNNDLDEVSVEVHWPPIAPNPYAGDIHYIQVFITSDSPVYFAHLVYKGELEVTVEAIAHIKPEFGIMPGYVIYGTSLHECKTVVFSGNPLVHVSGGGSIGSNSDARCDCIVDPVTGEPLGGSMTKGGNVNVDVVDGGEITVVGCWGSYGDSGSVNPEPKPGADQEDVSTLKNNVPIPDCGPLLPDWGPAAFNSGVDSISPGYYTSLKFNAGSDVTLEPGLYCIYGADPWAVEMKGGSTVRGDGVMFYFMSTTGGMKTAGGAQVYLNASDDLKDYDGNQWAGMLIYAHPDNLNDFVLTGTSNSWYEGTIFALGSHCDVEGNGGGVAFQTQIICDTVRANGSGDLDIFYTEDKIWHFPPELDLSK